MKKWSRWMAVGLVGIGMAFAQSAQATLLAYEPFDYTVGSDILGQNGGYGFSDAWRELSSGSVPAGSFTTVSGSLAHPSASLATTGNSALLTGEFGTLQPARDFANIDGTDGTTIWFSYIGQRMGEALDPIPTNFVNNAYPRGVNIGLFNADHATRAERISVGNSSNAEENEWSLIPEGSGSLRVGSGDPFSDTAWAVLRIDFVGDDTVADNYYLFLNPDPSVEPDIGSAAVTILGGTNLQYEASGLDYMRPFVGNASSGRPFGVLAADEIRLGTTYADMSAIPEPASVILVGLFGGGFLMLRRHFLQ